MPHGASLWDGAAALPAWRRGAWDVYGLLAGAALLAGGAGMAATLGAARLLAGLLARRKAHTE